MTGRQTTIALMLTTLIVFVGGCDNYKDITPENAKGVIYVYSSPSCAACKVAKPVINKLKEEGFNIKEIDVLRQPTKTGKARVNKIPTFVHYYNGNETKRIVGVASERSLRRMFRAK